MIGGNTYGGSGPGRELRPPMEQPEVVEAGRHDVHISRAANGFVLRIGCKTFVASTWAEAATGLEEYWENPHKAEKKYTQD